MLHYKEANLSQLKVILCDADGNLFPSEEPAFAASAVVTNHFLQELGVNRTFTPTELRLATTGKNFRTTAISLALSFGVEVEPELLARYVSDKSQFQIKSEQKENANHKQVLTSSLLEKWVAEEKREVTAYLRKALTPDESVKRSLTALSQRYSLALVSSSALSRVAASLQATDLDQLFPENLRFSAEDSLLHPTSKPDPAIYLFAAEHLKITPNQALAIEDSLAGAQAAVAAGLQTIGNIVFVPEEEQQARIAALKEVGVADIIFSWPELVTSLK